jgi:hypothetical protein
MTLKKLVKQFPENKSTYLALTDGVMGISKNVRIAWLEIKATDSLDPYKTELIDYGSHSYEFRTRVKAFEALERLRYCDEAVVRNLFDAMINPNTRLAGPAEKTLKALIKKQQNKDLATDYLKKNIWKDWQLEKLQKGLEGQ